MTPQSFVTLAGVTVAAIALAIISSNTSGLGGAIADRGNELIPGLTEKSNEIKHFEVDLGDVKTVITRDGETFRDASGYPVKASTVRGLTANLALLQIEEKKTADKARHSELRLGDAATDNGGERLTLKTASGGVIADVILGERDMTVGGTRGGQFVRMAGEDQTYLVRGYVGVPLSRVGWFETQLAQLSEDDITAIKATAGDQTLWSIKRAGSVLVPENLQDGDTPDVQKIGATARIVGPLRFSDVRKAADDGAPPTNAKTISFATKDGLTLTLTSLETAKADAAPKPTDAAAAKAAGSAEGDDTRWVRIAVESTSADSSEKAKELEKQVSGFDFRLGSTAYEKFDWTTEDFKSAPKS